MHYTSWEIISDISGSSQFSKSSIILWLILNYIWYQAFLLLAVSIRLSTFYEDNPNIRRSEPERIGEILPLLSGAAHHLHLVNIASWNNQAARRHIHYSLRAYVTWPCTTWKINNYLPNCQCSNLSSYRPSKSLA